MKEDTQQWVGLSGNLTIEQILFERYIIMNYVSVGITSQHPPISYCRIFCFLLDHFQNSFGEKQGSIGSQQATVLLCYLEY